MRLQGIVHRDLKTNNIFVASGEVLKVGDFGIAKQLVDAGVLAHTMVGTPYYMSPELLQVLLPPPPPPPPRPGGGA